MDCDGDAKLRGGNTQRSERNATCEHCKVTFSYYLVNNGFNDSAYAYCNSCGYTAILDDYAPRPKGVPFEPYKRISSKVEPYLLPCACGGRFTADSAPRCPHCRCALSPNDAATRIEANAPGASNGWRWQRSWDGLYCIVIDGRLTLNPWKTVTPE